MTREARYRSALMMIQYHDEDGFTETELAEIARTAAARMTVQGLSRLVASCQEVLSMRLANQRPEKESPRAS